MKFKISPVFQNGTPRYELTMEVSGMNWASAGGNLSPIKRWDYKGSYYSTKEAREAAMQAALHLEQQDEVFTLLED